MRNVPEKYLPFFMKELEKQNAVYSEEWKCPTSYLAKANYHTQLYHCDVHSTVAAFQYANALLLTGREEDLQRAIEVLDHVAHLQDKDPANATFGIWSWYMEEPLEKMAPPDWNWADFCGKSILQALIYHSERLPAELVDYLKYTLRCAALSIFRRNMHPGYTNISIMGSYVTLCAGQLLDWQEMKDYGKSRFTKAWDYTMKNGTFAEYNSATYTVEAIEDLSRIHMHIDDPDVHRMSGDMLDVAWRTVAEHFHAPTKQWTGPNARSYTWLTTDAALSFLRVGLDNGETLITDDRFAYSTKWPYIDMVCPDKYRAAFTDIVPHDVNLGFTTNTSIDKPRDTIAISHLTPEYTLASWETNMTWNQRRNLTGYWGGEQARFINATILHDLYDFSSAMFVTAQSGGNALVAASLNTDGGDTHCGLDLLKDETVTMYDLRMRIELGGAIENPPVVTGDTAVMEDGGIKLVVKLLDGTFDGQPVHLEVRNTAWDLEQQAANANVHRRFVGDEPRWYVDVVFYHGEYKPFKLSEIKAAYAAVTLSMEGAEPENAKIVTDPANVRETCAALAQDGVLSEVITENALYAEVVLGGDKLAVVCPAAPVTRAAWKGHAIINDVPMKKTYGL